MKRILVIRGGAIGDFVLTLPAIKLVRDEFPHARLEILGYKHIVALAENRFYADEVRSIEYGGLAGFFGKGAALLPALVEYFSSFDLVVSYLFDPDEIFRQNLKRCGVDCFLTCEPKIVGEDHAAVQLARPLEQLGLTLVDRAARLYPSESDREFARSSISSERTIAIHPGSGSARKNWPLEDWIALLDRLQTASAETSLLIIGGEADREQLKVLRSCLPPSVHFLENQSLEKLAAVIERCALFIGHDSGISHIAAAVGTPSILLFGETDPAVWAPANPNVRIISSRTRAMRDISVDEVQAAISAVGDISRVKN